MNEDIVAEIIAQYFADSEGDGDYTNYLRDAYNIVNALEDNGFRIVSEDEME